MNTETIYNTGMNVTHTDDAGSKHKATVLSVGEDGLLHLQFEDGDEGFETPDSCANTQDPQWYEFSAYNSEAIYGYGSETEANKYCDHLNKDREINVYAASTASGKDSDYCEHWNNLDDQLAAIAELEDGEEVEMTMKEYITTNDYQEHSDQDAVSYDNPADFADAAEAIASFDKFVADNKDDQELVKSKLETLNEAGDDYILIKEWARTEPA